MKILSYRIFLTFLLILSINILLTIVSYSQVTQEWVRRYSGISSHGSQGKSIKLDSEGNVYVLAGASTDTSYGDYCVIKYSTTGTFLWQAIYNTPGNLSDSPETFAVTATGDVYITGSSGINFVYHLLTIKFNSSGILQWARTYNGGGPGDDAYDIAVDRQGNVIIAGGTGVNNNSGYALTIKYNSNGDSLWVRKYTQNAISTNHKVVTDDSNNVYTTGYHEVGLMQENYLTLKYSRDGNLIWVSSYGLQPIGGEATCIAIDSNRNIYVAGTMYTLNPGYSDNALVKIYPNGDTAWTRVYTGIGGNNLCSYTPTGLSIASDGSAVYYTTACETQNSPEFVTLAYYSTGDSIWIRRYQIGGSGGPQYNPSNLKLDKNNNVYVTGSSAILNNGVIIKYLNNGTQQWVATGDSSSCKDIFIDSNLNFYVTGSRRVLNNIYNAVTIKYNQLVGIISNNSELPKSYKLHQNYPNPFNNSTVIEYELPLKSKVELKVYNSIGQLVKILVNSEQNASYYAIIFNAENLSSGIYFYQLKADDSVIETKKFILIK
jgi:hypothetical protein